MASSETFGNEEDIDNTLEVHHSQKQQQLPKETEEYAKSLLDSLGHQNDPKQPPKKDTFED